IFLRQAVDRSPGYHPARYYLGEAYLLNGQFDAAEKAWRDALCLAPDEPAYWPSWPICQPTGFTTPSGPKIGQPCCESWHVYRREHCQKASDERSKATPMPRWASSTLLAALGSPRSRQIISSLGFADACVGSTGRGSAACYNAQKIGGSVCKPRLTKSYSRCGRRLGKCDG
ncbi:MAG TPA: tetratricopeptide repeat protein, partial [Chloroflexota bacterium]|nr:tetratricopeptide repeat protein [Chloroflexota bacterium]